MLNVLIQLSYQRQNIMIAKTKKKTEGLKTNEEMVTNREQELSGRGRGDCRRKKGIAKKKRKRMKAEEDEVKGLLDLPSDFVIQSES